MRGSAAGSWYGIPLNRSAQRAKDSAHSNILGGSTNRTGTALRGGWSTQGPSSPYGPVPLDRGTQASYDSMRSNLLGGSTNRTGKPATASGWAAAGGAKVWPSSGGGSRSSGGGGSSRSSSGGGGGGGGPYGGGARIQDYSTTHRKATSTTPGPPQIQKADKAPALKPQAQAPNIAGTPAKAATTTLAKPPAGAQVLANNANMQILGTTPGGSLVDNVGRIDAGSARDPSADMRMAQYKTLQQQRQSLGPSAGYSPGRGFTTPPTKPIAAAPPRTVTPPRDAGLLLGGRATGDPKPPKQGVATSRPQVGIANAPVRSSGPGPNTGIGVEKPPNIGIGVEKPPKKR